MSRAPRKYATTSEAELRALVAEGLTFVQIAERLNLEVNMLRATACTLGIKSSYGLRSQGPLPLDTWIDKLAAGDTLEEIAASDGMTRQNVRQHLHRRGLPTTCRAAVKFKALQAQKAQG